MKAAVVVGGEADAADAHRLADAELVVAADGGATWLASIGVRPDVVIGDLDSIDPGLVARLEADGVSVVRHPLAKDATDAELAVDHAVSAGARRIVILGALAGQRLDHALANVLLLLRQAGPGALEDVRIVRGSVAVRAMRGGGRLALEGGPGSLVSLLALDGEASGVRTNGLRFALDGEALAMGSTRGISNVVTAAPASVSLERGALLVIEATTEGAEP